MATTTTIDENTKVDTNAEPAANTGNYMNYEQMAQKYGGNANNDSINKMFDAQKTATLAGYEQTYQQNLSDAEYAKSQINPAFRKSSNSLATQYERNKRNLNQQASMNGLNTGTASQQQLALNSNYLRDFGSLKENQANQLAEADRGIANLKATYQTQVQQAIAQNDFGRAQAIMNEFNNSFSRQMQLNENMANEASTRASFGDFSVYEQMYGPEAAASMKKLWITQNPKQAYQLGIITKKQYQKLVGTKKTTTRSSGQSAEDYFNSMMKDMIQQTGGNYGSDEVNAVGAAVDAKYGAGTASGLVGNILNG